MSFHAESGGDFLSPRALHKGRALRPLRGSFCPKMAQKVGSGSCGALGDLRRDPGSALFIFSVAEPIEAQGENTALLNWAGNQESGAWPGNTD